jgi:hypothetical protein
MNTTDCTNVDLCRCYIRVLLMHCDTAAAAVAATNGMLPSTGVLELSLPTHPTILSGLLVSCC